jgi:tRNA-specific 2-thiouridylase
MKSQVLSKKPVNRAKKGPKVFVGISGGVDSAVSAALLKKSGYDVTGVFIKVWQPDWIECNWKEERLDAMRVAAHLDIPFVTLDLEKEYKRDVIDYMISEYKAGRTPNPDVMCNRHVKFGAFWKWAKEQGADYIATGHYARIAEPKTRSGEGDLRARLARARGISQQGNIRAPELLRVEGEAYSLLAGVDSNKDQSYFLWTLNQSDLPHVLFPVGDMKKPDVRKLAQRFKLPNADKKDSQGLCFIGKVDIKEFLSHYVKTEYGKVLNDKGGVIGDHPGSLFFTIGERHGFTIDSHTKTPDDAAYFVTAKDMDKNTITVSQHRTDGESGGPENRSVSVSETSWVADAPIEGTRLKARTRYRQPLQEVEIASIGNDEAVVTFKYEQDAITPGQSLVIYDSEKCLGGGVIY